MIARFVFTSPFVTCAFVAVGCGCGPDHEQPPQLDAGPPRVDFGYGNKYPDPNIVGVNGVLTPTHSQFPTTWITARVFARHDDWVGGFESLDGLTGHLSVTSLEDDSLLAEATTPMTAILEDSSDMKIAWMDVSFEVCADARTKAGSELRVVLEATRENELFVQFDSGPQLIRPCADGPCAEACAP